MRSKTTCRFLLPIAWMFLTGCAVHHHYHYPEPAAEPVAEPAGPVEEFAEYDEYADEYDDYSEAQEIYAEPAPRVAPQVAPQAAPSAGGQGTLSDCDLINHPGGWVEAYCGGMTLVLQTGPSTMQVPDVHIGAYGTETAARMMRHNGDRVSERYGEVEEVRIEGQALKLTNFVLQIASTGGLTGPVSGKVGDHVGRGIHTIARTARGKTGMVCVQRGDLDRERCMNYFRELMTSSMEGIGKSPGAPIEIAGVPFEVWNRCHYNQPDGINCLLNGSMKWLRGTPDEAGASQETMLELWTDDNGIEGYYNPHTTRHCRIGGHGTTCHEVASQGVTRSPSRILYSAVVHTPHESYHVSCSVRVKDSFNGPCRAIFGGNTSGTWHR